MTETSTTPDPPGAGPRFPWSGVLSGLLFLAAFGWGLHRARMGLMLPDDGLYVSAPLRYALGDVPFRDEILDPYRMFDLVLAPLFMAWPDLTLLQLRVGWLVCQMGTMLALFALLRRFAPTLLAALACTAVVLFNVRGPTPGYQGMSASLLVLVSSLWLLACLDAPSRRSDLLAGASGVAVFVATLSYLPLLATWGVPAALGLLAWRGRAVPRRVLRPCVLHLLCASGLALAAVGLVFGLGLAGDWWQAHRAMISSRHYGSSPVQKLETVALALGSRWFSLLAPGAVVGWLLWVLARLPRRAGALLPGLAAGALGIALVYWTCIHGYRSEWHEHYAAYRLLERTSVLAVGVQLGALVAWLAGSRERSDDWVWVWACLAAEGSLYGALQIAASLDAHKLSWAVPLLFASGVVAAWRALRNLALPPLVARRATVLLVTLCAAFGLGTQFLMQRQYQTTMAGFDRLTARFEHPKLAGIYETPETVSELEDLLAYLDGRVAPGDTLLAYDFAPIVYYLTGTRPAVDSVWLPRKAAGWVRHRTLHYMLANGRVPEYCVRRIRAFDAPYSIDPRKDPLNHYVVTHYDEEARFGHYTVWRRRGPEEAAVPE